MSFFGLRLWSESYGKINASSVIFKSMVIIFIFGFAKKYEFLAENECILVRVYRFCLKVPYSVWKRAQKQSTNMMKHRRKISSMAF